VVRSAGGGGYGDPLARDPERVLSDVREGFISPASAHDLYGLVTDQRGGIDAQATCRLRQRLRAQRLRLRAHLDANVFEQGAISRRRICRLHPTDAARFAHGALVELDAGRAAPLRCWVRCDANVQPGTIPIDERGLAILRAMAGEDVELRQVSVAGDPARSGH
jgi:N-methylhydantoinase B